MCNANSENERERMQAQSRAGGHWGGGGEKKSERVREYLCLGDSYHFLEKAVFSYIFGFMQQFMLEVAYIHLCTAVTRQKEFSLGGVCFRQFFRGHFTISYGFKEIVSIPREKWTLLEVFSTIWLALPSSPHQRKCAKFIFPRHKEFTLHFSIPFVLALSSQ